MRPLSSAILLGFLTGPALASAQSGAESSGVGGRESGPSSSIADGIDGLPGMFRIGIPATPAPRVGGSLWFNYAYTEPQTDDDGSHHRLGATAAIGGALFPYLAGAVRLDFRHDLHGEDDLENLGKDSGSVFDLAPILRVGLPVTPRFSLGLEGRALFSGAASHEKLAPPTVDTRLQAAYRGPAEITVAGYAGVRTAQTGSGVSEAALLRPGDRIALGLSEFPAVLLGLGLQKDFNKTSVFLEGTYDLLVGKNSPPAGQSPYRIGLGLKQIVIPGLTLSAVAEVAPGQRAPSTVDDPLVPIEPRISALLGISVRFPDVSPSRPVEEPPPEPQDAPPEPVAQPTVVEPTVTAHLTIEVVDETGHPISDATVKVVLPATDTEAERVVVVPLAELNRYETSDLPLGEAEISIEADLLEGQRQTIQLQEETSVSVKLNKASGVGSQLRGLVRSFAGKGVTAKILVQPGNHKVTCDENGEFVLDLPPGTYSVTIQAEGYVSQKRRLRVVKEGVTVLNADLQRK